MKTNNYKKKRVAVSFVLIVLGLIYCILPFDGDFIPVVGWIDDVVVLFVDAIIVVVSQMWLKKKESLKTKTVSTSELCN